MNQVRRLYVEKKAGFDGEAKALGNDLRQQLNIPELIDVRVLVRYDVAGLDDEAYEAACASIFSEPMVDRTFGEDLPQGMGEAFAREYLPGQYDQRADSAAQCVQLLTQAERPQVRVATVFGLIGTLNKAQVEAVKEYLINPVDSCKGKWKSSPPWSFCWTHRRMFRSWKGSPPFPGRIRRSFGSRWGWPCPWRMLFLWRTILRSREGIPF